MQFFQEALLEKLAKEKRLLNKKLVLLITGLEESIELAGDYPYVLQDLNYVRDSFSDKVPYPLVFFLPDYAITRLAKFAPDFWAWQLGIFEFHTPPEGEPIQETIDPNILQQQLDELQKLLEKHSHTQRPTTLTTQKIYAQITRLYRNLGQENADPVFRTVLQLPPLMPRQADILRWWGTLKRDSGHTDESLKLYQQALEIEEKIKDDRNEARTLQELAVLYNDRQDFERAKNLIQDALEIHKKIGDTNVQAQQFLESLEKSKKAIGLEQDAYRQAQKGNTQKAIELYTKLLKLYEELGNPDRLVITRTMFSLAELLAESNQDLEKARQYLTEVNNIYRDQYRSDTQKIQRLLDQIDAKLRGQTHPSWFDRIFS